MKLVLATKNEQNDLIDAKSDAKKTLSTVPNNSTAVDSLMNEVMKDVAEKADKLEDSMKDNVFKEKQNTKGTTIETVLKVDKGEKIGTSNQTKSSGNSMLIDSDNNQYVLSKPGDITDHVEGI